MCYDDTSLSVRERSGRFEHAGIGCGKVFRNVAMLLVPELALDADERSLVAGDGFFFDLAHNELRCLENGLACESSVREERVWL